MIQIYPIKGIPEIKEGDQLSKIIASLFKFKDGDILAVCSTIVSKSEGRIKRLEEIEAGEKAAKLAKKLGKDPRFIQAVLDESEEIVIDHPFLLTKAKFGNICVNAGIDSSNVKKGFILLPPEDPDRSAREIRKGIKRITGKDIGVVITDSNGRCFRKGVVGFAIGVSGIRVMEDWRRRKDIYGKELEITVECLADEIAGFANLIMGEGDSGIPAVVFRGLDIRGNGRASEIYRSYEEDVIRRLISRWKREDF